jgi:uncharacterized membrane protein (UPF0127 family)
MMAGCTPEAVRPLETVPGSSIAHSGRSNLLIFLKSPDGNTRIPVTAEIAADQASQQKGLMFRTRLDMGTGMLFIFDRPKKLSFWMKNTLIPLDILFFDAEGNLVSSTAMVPCQKDPCPLHQSSGDALFALEVPGGFIAQSGVGPGWQLRTNQAM